MLVLRGALRGGDIDCADRSTSPGAAFRAVIIVVDAAVSGGARPPCAVAVVVIRSSLPRGCDGGAGGGETQ